ncbi:hypothetical protein WS63_22095 [Burkholderia stagnalis]|uniref:hypothetical protein n=1 Tax=Burkholderia stagnalis TaxID=1503054 RepID=UPI0007564312|nr:hypothetical protein [Burkholderia stagnalis]KVC55761.1 hypothetical protein WS59_28835 [Burkholderia stagnalis]KVD85696.1 hypothetical protein WS63_22095 [Burkholderia stagnalis]KVN12910.1 hypothetical protein WT10_27000 [Burkholderia stagnalis]KWI69468.1 hypothetical protein WT75_18945 [Burkholderia stagnalis]KWK68952.1 hypothetical protein WT82_15215 [Burkholderia stagnalis]
MMTICGTRYDNSAASSTTTTKAIVDAPLLMSTVIGTETYGIVEIGPGGGTLTLTQTTVPAMLGSAGGASMRRLPRLPLQIVHDLLREEVARRPLRLRAAGKDRFE